jgi:hypothetical protein
MGLFDRFKPATLEVPGLGTLQRRRHAWRGSISLGASPAAPLELAGARGGVPDVRLHLARELIARYDRLRPAIQDGLYAHYEPYLEAPDDEAMPAIRSASGIWDHVRVAHVRIAPIAGIETVEIGFETAWDVEHTPAARFQDWQLVEFNGSVPGVY